MIGNFIVNIKGLFITSLSCHVNIKSILMEELFLDYFL